MPRVSACCVLLLIPLLLAGCARAPMAAPAAEALIVVFADGFHSGIVLARADVPAGLLPPQATRPWVAIHFGERRWISGQADGLCDALRLGLSAGEGGVQVDSVAWWVHDRGGTDPARVRVWAFPVARRSLEALTARLDSWIEPEAVQAQLRPGSAWWPSRRAWTLRTNCHDFTADLLSAAGIPVSTPPIMLAEPLRHALDRAWSEADAGR